MAEWLIAPVLKTGGPQGLGGSNPSPSAKLVSAEMWSVLTIYNGVRGIPSQTAGSHTEFYSPLQFNPTTGRWIFHSNTTNPDYVRRVVGAGMISNPRE